MQLTRINYCETKTAMEGYGVSCALWQHFLMYFPSVHIVGV